MTGTTGNWLSGTAWASCDGVCRTRTSNAIPVLTAARGAKGFKAKDLCDVLMTVAAGKSGDISPSRLGRWLHSHRDREIERTSNN